MKKLLVAIAILAAVYLGGMFGLSFVSPGGGGNLQIFLAMVSLTVLVAAFILSERQRVATALRQSELQLRFVWENSIDGMRLMDEAGLMLAVNTAYCQLMERPRESLQGHSVAILYPPDRREEILQHHHEDFRNRSFDPHVEKEMTLADGRKIHLELSNSFLDLEGQQPLLLTIFRDITERKQSEAVRAKISQLGQNLSTARSALEAARAIGEVTNDLFGWDAFTLNLYTYENDQVAISPILNVDTINGKREEISNDEIGQNFSQRDRDMLQSSGELVLKKEPITMLPDISPFGDKSRPSASLMFVPTRNRNRVVGVLSVQSYSLNAYNQEDLRVLQTLADYCGASLERVRAETALRGSDALKGAIMESALDGIITMDREGKIMEFNSAAQKTFGCSRAEALGREMAGFLLPAPFSDRLRDGLIHYLATGETTFLGERIEIMARRLDGVEFPAELAVSPLQIEGGPIFTGYLRDITERKSTEKMLREMPGQILQAEEAERMRVARELHDSVNQILSATKFRLDSVDESGPPPAGPALENFNKARELLDKAMHEVWRISRNLRPSELDDLGLIPAVRSLCHEFEHRTGIKVELQLARTTPLPPGIELTLYRIVQEALNNVEKHSEATEVKLSLSQANPWITMNIEDNGVGLQSSAPQRKSGMGLVGMQERTAFAGGTVEVRSIPDHGTIIEVKLPAGVNGTEPA